MIWPNFLKWFTTVYQVVGTLAQEKMRAPITKARSMDHTGDILTTAQGFTGRDNATFIKTSSPAPKAPARRLGGDQVFQIKPGPEATCSV